MNEYIEEVLKFAVYVNKEEKTVGIYATNEDSFTAEKSYALKRLRNLYKFKIQMVIK